MDLDNFKALFNKEAQESREPTILRDQSIAFEDLTEQDQSLLIDQRESEIMVPEVEGLEDNDTYEAF